MLWFLLIGCLFILVLSGILIYRTLIQHQLDQVKIPNDGATKKFKRKLAFLKQKETSKHVMYLIIWGMGVLIFLLFMMVSFYIAETNRTNEMATLKAEVSKLKTEQQYLIEKRTIRFKAWALLMQIGKASCQEKIVRKSKKILNKRLQKN